MLQQSWESKLRLLSFAVCVNRSSSEYFFSYLWRFLWRFRICDDRLEQQFFLQTNLPNEFRWIPQKCFGSAYFNISSIGSFREVQREEQDKQMAALEQERQRNQVLSWPPGNSERNGPTVIPRIGCLQNFTLCCYRRTHLSIRKSFFGIDAASVGKRERTILKTTSEMIRQQWQFCR